MTIVSDKGSETGTMIEFQKALRFVRHRVLDTIPELNAVVVVVIVVVVIVVVVVVVVVRTSDRRDAAPEIPEDEFKPWVQVQSKHNTPIEGFWPWLRQGEGLNIRTTIVSGSAAYDPNDPLHV